MKKNPFILIGKAADYFDLNLNCLRKINFKFLLLQEEGVIRMMIMVKHEPYILHAQGLLSYMEENNLSEITVCGGGYIYFTSIMCQAEVSQFSYAFKSVDGGEVSNFLRGVWPQMEIDIEAIEKVTEDDTQYYRIYTLEEVRLKANEPA